MSRVALLILAQTLCIFVPIRAQTLNDFVAKYGNENGSGFMQPLADAFGANLNSGLYQTATIPLKGFHLNFSVMLMGAPTTDSRKTFSAKTEGFFTPQTTVDAPTLFGSTDGKTVSGVGGTSYVFPGGLDISLFLLAVPQLTVGSFYGTEATVRFVQATVGDNFGQLMLWGIGARHNMNQYFKKLPLNVAVGIYQQHFEIGDIVSANATLFSVQGSYTTSVFTVYGGPGVEFSNLDVNYDGSSGKINLSLKSANSIRFTVGGLLSLAFFRLFADYNLASQSSFVLGIGFGF